jgi:hypothetical protein
MIEPLNLELWIINVFSGDSSIFAIISLLIITSMAAYFRMNAIGMFFMIGIFLLMFSGYIPVTLVVFITIIAGLLIGYSISKIVKN